MQLFEHAPLQTFSVIHSVLCFICILHSLLDSELCEGSATSFHSKILAFIPRITDILKTYLVRIGFEGSQQCSLSEEHHVDQGMDVLCYAHDKHIGTVRVC